MKSFFGAFLSFGLATSIQKLLGFIILPIYTRYFDKFQYGVIDMITTILAVASIFGLLQLETALQRYYYEYQGLKRKLLISNIYLWIGGCSFLISVFLFVLAPYVSDLIFRTNIYANLIRLASVQLPFSNLGILGLILLRYEKENLKFLIVIVTNVISTILFVYLFVMHFEYGLSGVFYAQTSAVIVSTSLVTYYSRRSFVMRLSNLITYKNLKYALPQFPARIGSMILSQANRFFMLGYLSIAAIGLFSVSLKLASSVQLVNTAFILAWAPFMNTQFKNPNNKKVFAKVFPLVGAGTFLCVCLIALFSQEMVQLLTTQEFHSAHKYVGGLALYYSFFIIKETIDIGPKIREKTKYLSVTFLISVAVNVVSLLFLIKIFGVEGVVYAMLITNLFLVILSWAISNRLYYIPFSVSAFAICLMPALILSVYLMHFDLSFIGRVGISFLCLFFYGGFLFISYNKIRKISVF